MSPRSALPLLACLAWAVAAAAAPVETAPYKGWLSGFPPASPATVAGLKAYAATPAGLSLAERIPAFKQLPELRPDSPEDQRLIGALAAAWPDGTEARLDSALGRADEAELAALADTLAEAHRVAAPALAHAALAAGRGRAAGLARLTARRLLAGLRGAEPEDAVSAAEAFARPSGLSAALPRGREEVLRPAIERAPSESAPAARGQSDLLLFLAAGAVIAIALYFWADLVSVVTR